MHATRVRTWADLKGQHERAVFDAKREYADGPLRPFEMAKDVAALAAAVGGVIVVGAIEGKGGDSGKVVSLQPVSAPGALVTAFSEAVRAHCRPTPTIDPIVISLEAAQAEAVLGRPWTSGAVDVVAVNVEPNPIGPVAVRVADDAGQPIDGAYRFPNRLGERSEYMTPERLAMTWSTHERKVALQFAEAEGVWNEKAPGTKLRLFVYDDEYVTIPNRQKLATVVVVDHDRMHVEIEPDYKRPNGPTTARVPFAFVRALWQDPGSDTFSIAIEGIVCGWGGMARSFLPAFVPRTART